MCISGNIRKVMHGNVPKVGYKLMKRNSNGTLVTPYKWQTMVPYVFVVPVTKKVINKYQDITDADYLNHGRLSVFLDKKEAKCMLDRHDNELWLVEIASNTAFLGAWSGNKVAVVDSIKLVKRIAKYGLWRRFKRWCGWS